MPLYPVLENATYTIGDKVYGPGEHVDLTEGQAAPWLGLLLDEPLSAKETRAIEKAEAAEVKVDAKAAKATAQAAKEEVKTNVG